MTKATRACTTHPGAPAAGQVLAAAATALQHEPFNTGARERAENTLRDYFQQQGPAQAVPSAANMFERVRHDGRLPPPLRHALMTTLDRSVSRVSGAYRDACAPLCTLAALDTWRAERYHHVLAAIGRSESRAAAVPLTADEQARAHAQAALLSRVFPAPVGERPTLGRADSQGKPVAPVAAHLQRASYMTLDATVSAGAVRRLTAFLDTAAGRACLAARAAWQGPVPDANERVPTPDPPEMSSFQEALAQSLQEAAGSDPVARAAYHAELSARVEARLRDTF